MLCCDWLVVSFTDHVCNRWYHSLTAFASDHSLWLLTMNAMPCQKAIQVMFCPCLLDMNWTDHLCVGYGWSKWGNGTKSMNKNSRETSAMRSSEEKNHTNCNWSATCKFVTSDTPKSKWSTAWNCCHFQLFSWRINVNLINLRTLIFEEITLLNTLEGPYSQAPYLIPYVNP